MRILFNCSVNIVGGAVQNAANFIKYAALSSEHDFVFLISKPVKKILQDWGVINIDSYVLDSPSQSNAARLKALEIEHNFSPDVVYTMAGPTYIRFKSIHIMGISDPYITHADKLSLFLNRSFNDAVTFGFKELVKGMISRLTADHYVFQTETSRKGFSKRYFLKSEKTSILQNAIGEDFNSFTPVSNETLAKPCKVFVPSAYYPHKNLEIIIRICEYLKKEDDLQTFEFITTAPFNCAFSKAIESKGFSNVIKNVGPYSYSNAYALYEKCHIVFMPSVLETFSTSYLEAIAMGKPLVVADRSFSREVCGNYARYYSPLSVFDAVEVLRNTINYNVDLVEREKIITRYGTQKERFNKAIIILESVLKKGNC